MYKEETDSGPEKEESQYAPEDEIIEEEKQEMQKQPPLKRKSKMLDYLNKDTKKISNRIFLGQTVSPFEDAGNSAAIDRTA